MIFNAFIKKLGCALVLLAAFIVYASAQNETASFKRVFDVIASQFVFTASFGNLIGQLKDCKKSSRPEFEQLKFGNVECTKEVGVESFDVPGTASPKIGPIQSSFRGLDKCAYMKNTLIQNFGKPDKTDEKCNLHWYLKPLKKGGPMRYANLEADEAAKVVYFSIGEEQGP